MYSGHSNQQSNRFHRPQPPPPGPRFGSPSPPWRPQNSPFRQHSPRGYSPQQRGYHHHQPQFNQRSQSSGPHSNRFPRYDSPNYRGHHHSKPYRGGGHRGRHSHRGKHHHHHHHLQHQYNNKADIGTHYYRESMVKDPWEGMTPISVDGQR
ncbi:M-phase-specific PLK1-interacting protein-like [Ptychodera flava]|uniref:M-phase-specific PLK1-interacting protein-like n=1 Tax=Ptychodera flava TaxID=63121 RepID=UPI00396A4016